MKWARQISFTISFLVLALRCPAAPSEYFAIHVLDEATGRGVPLVELTTVNHISHWTDSGGWIAFNEPGLMNQEIFFHVQSYGYEFPEDGFHNRGVKLAVRPGGSAEIKLKRLNLAERLYRITGEGIYHDTLLLGRKPPTKQPVLNGKVTGQDTVIATVYRDKVYWFWGDTDKPSYPLGNFGASGATSELPAHGGLDPSIGVDLHYFVDRDGFSKPMCPDFGPGLQWIESLITLPDDHGTEHLFARVTSAAGVAQANAWHLARFNDDKQIFESLVRWDIHASHNVATPFRARVGATEYLYLYPDYRVKAQLDSLQNLRSYEIFTCLTPPAPNGGQPGVERTPDGKLLYTWRNGFDRVDGLRRQLVRDGLVPAEESKQRDVETGNPTQLGRGSVAWNPYRKRWVMIASALPGEVWFSEADTPAGPWLYTRRVVSHNHYNFYNPTHHRFFDQQGGRFIYFEGTYTATFSDAKTKTPRYDYNQIMYRLDLEDPRLNLPAPVYVVREDDKSEGWMMREQLAGAWGKIQSLAFFAIPPGRNPNGLVPIYQITESGRPRLQTTASKPSGQTPVFLALPATAADIKAQELEAGIVPLYEYRDATGKLRYAPELQEAGWIRSALPLCRVWRNPRTSLVLDSEPLPE